MQRKIRIGYISGDFYDCATSHLVVRLFELHNREDFDVYVYSYGPKIDDAYRANDIWRSKSSYFDLYNCFIDRIFFDIKISVCVWI